MHPSASPIKCVQPLHKLLECVPPFCKHWPGKGSKHALQACKGDASMNCASIGRVRGSLCKLLGQQAAPGEPAQGMCCTGKDERFKEQKASHLLPWGLVAYVPCKPQLCLHQEQRRSCMPTHAYKEHTGFWVASPSTHRCPSLAGGEMLNPGRYARARAHKNTHIHTHVWAIM